MIAAAAHSAPAAGPSAPASGAPAGLGSTPAGGDSFQEIFAQLAALVEPAAPAAGATTQAAAALVPGKAKTPAAGESADKIANKLLTGAGGKEMASAKAALVPAAQTLPAAALKDAAPGTGTGKATARTHGGANLASPAQASPAQASPAQASDAPGVLPASVMSAGAAGATVVPGSAGTKAETPPALAPGPRAGTAGQTGGENSGEVKPPAGGNYAFGLWVKPTANTLPPAAPGNASAAATAKPGAGHADKAADAETAANALEPTAAADAGTAAAGNPPATAATAVSPLAHLIPATLSPARDLPHDVPHDLPPAAAASPASALSPAAESDGAAQPVHAVAVQVAGADEQRVDLRLVEHAGSLTVSVRTTDDGLTHELRDRLPELSARLEAEHYTAQTWLPAAAQASSGGFSEQRSGQPFGESSSGGSGSGSGSGGGQRQPQGQQQQQGGKNSKQNNR